MILLIKKKYFAAAAGGAAIFLLLMLGILFQQQNVPVFASHDNAPVLIIDAGHGGEDGGAVAMDGTVESEINLAVAKRLREILCFTGHDVVMTREEEKSLSENSKGTLRERKRLDLERRVELVNHHPNAILISIHQNSLPNYFSVHGAQVFYNTQEGSEILAEAIQEQLNLWINTDKAKSHKPIDPSIYLMKNIHCRAVLVECGFLSNAEETKKLKQPGHQTLLALTIAAGIFPFLQEK